MTPFTTEGRNNTNYRRNITVHVCITPTPRVSAVAGFLNILFIHETLNVTWPKGYIT